MTHTQILGQYQDTDRGWRTGNAGQQSAAVTELDLSLTELDRIDAPNDIDVLGGRIEILMDEIAIHLGMDLPPL